MPSKRAFKYSTIIGGWRPFHKAHQALVMNALEVSDRAVIVVGSKENTLSARNPFPASQRQRMITDSLDARTLERIDFVQVHDHLYNHRNWVSELRQAVEKTTSDSDSITLVGHNKDASSAYLSDFPDWTPTALPIHLEGLSATHVRQWLYEDQHSELASHVPEGTLAFLEHYITTDEYQRMLKEYHYIKEYRAAWADSPYPPIFVAVDKVITYSDYVLLIRRGGYPGHGLWALPGGFLNADETIEAAARRELREETGLNGEYLSYRGQKVFDHPQRSQLGRMITHAFHYEASSMPRAIAGDDAADVRWFPIHKLANIRSQLFDDHFHILEHFLGVF